MTSIAVAFNYDGIDKDTRGKLTTLAGQIKRGKAGYAKAVLEIGAAIHEAHELLAGNGREGKFSGWVEGECGLERRTAYNYLYAFDAFNKCPTVEHFSAGAMYALSAPAVPEKARREAIKRATSGEKITKSVADDIIDNFTVEPEKKCATVSHLSPKSEPEKNLEKTPVRPVEPQQENFAPAAESQDDPPGDGPCLRGGDHAWGDEGDCEKCHEPEVQGDGKPLPDYMVRKDAPATPEVKRPSGGTGFNPSEWEQEPIERMQGLHAEMRAALVAFKKPWNEAKEGQHGAYLQVRESRMASAYQELWDAVAMAVPVRDCPKCDKHGCKFCAGTGWLSKLQATSLPKEARA